MSVIERMAFVLLAPIWALFVLLWLALPCIAGVVIGLPVAGIKFIFTGRSGIDWFVMTAMGWMEEHCLPMMWIESMERRRP